MALLRLTEHFMQATSMDRGGRILGQPETVESRDMPDIE